MTIETLGYRLVFWTWEDSKTVRLSEQETLQVKGLCVSSIGREALFKKCNVPEAIVNSGTLELILDKQTTKGNHTLVEIDTLWQRKN